MTMKSNKLINFLTKENSKAFFAVVLTCAFFVLRNSAPNNALPPEDENSPYRVEAIPLPDDLFFAQEKISLNDPDVKERLDREILVNTYWQSNALLMLKRANKYFPIIEPILAEYGVPDDFKYLAVIESGLQNVTSPAGAKGFWQIMPKTGKEYGLEINSNVDERLHLKKATEAACSYLIRAKRELGSWTLAAASYNAGVQGIKRRLEEQQVDNYFDLLLGEETGRYVFRVLALKRIFSNPEGHGFFVQSEDLYQPIPTKTVVVDTAITDFVKFAKTNGVTYKTLKIHNPWLRDPFLNNASRKVYEIEIPLLAEDQRQ